ncbi:PREDICTED: lymphatic vessel endothelial hyaluronic acid receptor 1-like [Nanorana parkeri]|uniref:lymphatic vessel endothelial hyaluronic acid receptor 1-like n=1 Tax=Nanorana parkeri TaxID=125878 RepID=UPI0008547546|nr:PREDICTED: lymphatic vessel endothelial hyaluronic acid receptor 1-like [Nanorana parkeri]
MLQQTLRLSILLALLGICSAQDIPVMSGVFMPSNITGDYFQAKAVCAMHHSRLATMEEITRAYKNGYEYCKWGWIDDHRQVMLRLTPFLPCAGYSMGILIKDCPSIRSAFCVSGSGSEENVTVIGVDRVPSYENATRACQDAGLVIASKQQVENDITNIADPRYATQILAPPIFSMKEETISDAAHSGHAWYNGGVGEIRNGKLVSDVCYDTTSQASAFCYNPSLPDFIINNDNKTWKKIVMGCLLALIFIVLLFAAAFMKGNKFMCCMGERKSQPPVVPQGQMPSWNNTGNYRRISQGNKGALYDNSAHVERRPSTIRPGLNLYKTHYTNMAFDTTGEQ